MAIVNNLASSSIRKFLPNKVITGTSLAITGLESWMYDDGMGDPWWAGAANAPYRWVLTASVDQSNHSSHLTRVPNLYTGIDIAPGMWVYADGEAKAVKIISIINKTDLEISCIVEDIDRYNTFTDRTGSGLGIFSTGRTLVFFELGDDGLPILNPLPDYSDIASVSQVEARFRVFNPVVEIRFFQLNHGFKEGQVLRINPQTGMFVHATSSDIYVAGTVTAVGPGPNFFYLVPSTKVITNLEPGLPGNVGDIIGIDATSGDRTAGPIDALAALYIKLTQEVPCFSVGSIDNPTVWDGTTIKLNNQTITFSDQEGPVPTATIIQTINQFTDSTGVLASMGSPTTVVVGTEMYPTSTPSLPLEFKINGVFMSVPTSPSIVYGTSGDIGWWDVIRSINELTSKHGVYASFDTNTGFVTLQSNQGGDILIENIQPAITDGADKTVCDMFGVPEQTLAEPASRLKLVRPDGGEISITDVSGGSFSVDTGVQSAATGELPMALVVDKTMNANANYMVADIPGRDALANLRTGDQVFVQSAEDDEWALFVKTNAGWTKISDYDSAKTDADTLEVTITHDSPSMVQAGNVSGGARIVNVSVVVTTAFDSDTAIVTVGTLGDPDSIAGSDFSDLAVKGSYEGYSSYTFPLGTDGVVYVNLEANGATTGVARVLISYL